MKLQSRLALTVGAAAAIAIIGMAAAFWVLSASQQRSDVDESLIRVVDQPREFVRGAGSLRDIQGADRRGPGLAPDRPAQPLALGVGGGAADDRLFTRIRVTLEGELAIDQGLPEAVGVTADSPTTLSTVEIDGERYRMAVAPIRRGPVTGVVQVARNIEDLESGLMRLRQQIIGASLAGIALAALLGALVARRLSAPITQVAGAAREMSFGPELPSPIEVTRSDEVGDLATSFNQMLSALELSRNQQQRLVADASHELRTPLTSLRLKLDLLDSRPDLPEAQRQDLLATSALEVEKLSELVTELVVLATDPTGTEEELVEQSLPALVDEVAAMHEQRSGRSIEVIASGTDAAFPMRIRMTRRAVSNLIDNAVKYSTEGSPVTITVTGGKIEVRDRGEGIPAEDLQHVFDRFYRSPTARTRPGNGIGLAIVKRVAELHGGTTWARIDDDHNGAVVGFSLG